LLIFEVEEVGHVVDSVRGLSFTNHPALNYSWFKISVHQRSGIFGSHPGTVPEICHFLMHRLAIKPPMPRTESITIMLGSGTTLGVESRLTTRKPSMIEMLAPRLPTIDDDKKLEPLNLSPDGGSFTRAAPPLGSRWLRFDSKRFAFLGRSHLSPDGGSFTRAAPPLGSRWLRFDSKRFAFLGRSHLSPDVGSVTRAAVHRLAADGYGKRAKGKRVTSSSAS
jgi:hypothetical protein